MERKWAYALSREKVTKARAIQEEVSENVSDILTLPLEFSTESNGKMLVWGHT